MMPFVRKTDVGRKRDHNEDACDAFSVTINNVPVTVLALADGMGGLDSGEVASSIFISTTRRIIQQYVSGQGKRWKPDHVIKEIFAEANKLIFTTGQQKGLKQIGTTGIIAIIGECHCTLGWVGDSRAYRYHSENGKMLQISRDHSLVQSLIDAGQITEQDALIHPNKNVVLRGVGIKAEEGPPEIIDFFLKKKDIILLCSDGLSNEIPRSFMEKNCAEYSKKHPSKPPIIQNTNKTSVAGAILPVASLESLGDRLVNAANENGGRDNISLVLYECPGLSRFIQTVRSVLIGIIVAMILLSLFLVFRYISLKKQADGVAAGKNQPTKTDLDINKNRRP